MLSPPRSHHTPKTVDTLFSSASLHLQRQKTRIDNFFRDQNPDTQPEQDFSIADIIRFAAEKFIDSTTEPTDPPSGNSDDDDDDDDEVANDVKLIHQLLRAANELDHKQYEQATHFLNLCDFSSSKTGNLAQRITHYFVHALREKLRKETGSGTHPIADLMNRFQRLNVEETITAISPIVAVLYEKIPFFQVGQLAGVQAIVESVEKAKRIHIIDLRIRNGMQWTALMQALSTASKGKRRRRRAPEILKITAIVTISENLVRGTGERLAKFAESMEIPFEFNTIVVSSFTELDEAQFDLDPRETVAVFGEYALQGLVSDPNELEALMEVLKKISPSIMVVLESEVNLNSSNFARRFVEMLFHYGAYFDCLDACLDSSTGERGLIESMFLNKITELLVKEGEEMPRVVTVDVWRKFFGQFSVWEVGLSSSAMETVNLLLGRFVKGKWCTLDMDGRCLIVGWKGTPIFSLSTWKFLH
ncbi:unnamed protein product [Linum tenue]|uniref:Uncharacterized protein n=2 Tax=Linum tenue TaxID=586396 RepID=A0AAV0Q8C7_9ROSI|nr:unnamed protein product [Linum tenue]